MGRGKAPASIQLIVAAYDILKAIQPASIRAVCYQLFIQKLIPSMAKNETNRVSTQLRDARESGDIPWHWIVDETRAAKYVNAWENLAGYLETMRRLYRRDRWSDQPDRIEVWSEKGTIQGTLAPILHEYGVTFRVMHGYGSTTAVHDVAEESLEGRPLTILYVGDWDPSGLHMSEVDLPARIHRYGGEVDIVRVALTADHVEMANLPSFAAAEKTKDPRFRWYVEHHGQRCWELDALNPVILRDEVEGAILARLDLPAWRQAAQAEQAERESIKSILDAWPGISRQAQKYERDTP